MLTVNQQINKPKVAVVVLTYNHKDLLHDSLSTYLDNDYPNYEVVVIDNGSSDGTFDFVKESYPKASVIRTENNLGYSGGLNFGLHHAFNEIHADYALVSNNDVKADKNVINELIKVAQSDNKIGFVTGKVYYYDHPDILQTVGKYEDPIRWNGDHIGCQEKDTGHYDTISERIFIDDIFMLVSQKLYKEIGGYDTNFRFQSEEYDWQARAKKNGYIIMYTPFAKIWHKVSMTIGKQSAFKAYYDARNPMLVQLLHRPASAFRKYFWYHSKNVLFISLKHIKNLQFHAAFKNTQGFLSGIWWGLKNKKFSLNHFM